MEPDRPLDAQEGLSSMGHFACKHAAAVMQQPYTRVGAPRAAHSTASLGQAHSTATLGDACSCVWRHV